MTSKPAGWINRRIDLLCVRHGWNRLTCEQRNCRHVAHELLERHFLGAAQHANEPAAARYFAVSSRESADTGTRSRSRGGLEKHRCREKSFGRKTRAGAGIFRVEIG